MSLCLTVRTLLLIVLDLVSSLQQGNINLSNKQYRTLHALSLRDSFSNKFNLGKLTPLSKV